MNNQEAKFILGAYRPGGGDAGDPMFAEALKQAQVDPALAAWFARERAHDAAMTAKLGEIAPPTGLREAILAGTRASRTARVGRRWAVWSTLGMAAAAVLTWSLAGPTIRANVTERRLEKFVLADVANEAAHHGGGHEAQALQAVLSRPSTKLSRSLPVDFATLEATGCRTLRFGGRDMIEVCFERDGRWFHLYAMRVPPDAVRPADPAPRFASDDGYCCVSWVNQAGNCRFVVGTRGDTATVAALL